MFTAESFSTGPTPSDTGFDPHEDQPVPASWSRSLAGSRSAVGMASERMPPQKPAPDDPIEYDAFP